MMGPAGTEGAPIAPSVPAASYRTASGSTFSLVFNILFIGDSPTRPTLIFQGVSVSPSLAQREPNLNMTITVTLEKVDGGLMKLKSGEH